MREDVRIDGDRNEDSTGVTIDADGKSRVLEITGSGTDAKSDGLTITGGFSDGDGGGILLRGSNLLEITDSRIHRQLVLQLPRALQPRRWHFRRSGAAVLFHR